MLPDIVLLLLGIIVKDPTDEIEATTLLDTTFELLILFDGEKLDIWDPLNDEVVELVPLTDS